MRRGGLGSGMDMRLDRPLDQVLKKKIAPYELEVGVLNDGPHYAPAWGVFKRGKNKGKPRLKSYAGGPARRQTRRLNGTLSSVSKAVRSFLGFNYLTRPFQKSFVKGKDIRLFMYQFFKLVFSESKLARKKRVENLLQAVVRNPILRGDYGRNSRAWAKLKGFNRKLIDTAQFFKSIEARVRVKRVP